MKKNLQTKKTSLLFLLALFLIVNQSCKQLEVERLPGVKTDDVTNIGTNSATVYGDIFDIGAEDQLLDHGFCFSTSTPPTVNDIVLPLGTKSSTGTFFGDLYLSEDNMTYYVRAYVDDGSEYYYGKTLEFKTLYGGGGGNEDYWLNHDDGTNFDGIGLTEGGSFDIAARFNAFELVPYSGFKISKIAFFPKSYGVNGYNITIWEGSEPTLLVNQPVSTYFIDSWNNVDLTSDVYIDATSDMWFGVWIIDQEPDIYPAGCDDGPAYTGYGDLISMDDGATWDNLSELDPPNLDYNWNIQVYITNYKGEEVLLGGNTSVDRSKLYYTPAAYLNSEVVRMKN